jgi:ABC-2 type transport system ATP-binding protein
MNAHRVCLVKGPEEAAVEAFVEVTGLEKIYRGSGLGGTPVAALAGISFRIAPGELMGLLGPNGAGKTTTVKILSGLVAPTAGRAELMGRPSHEPRARAALGYMPERSSPPEHLNGLECIEREGRMFSLARATRKRAVETLPAKVGLDPKVATRRVSTYSKGERARLGIALALVPDPKIILLDEPTDGLDPVGRREVRELLVALKGEGRAILLNSHLLSEAELCCDHVSILARGQVVASGKTQELLSSGTQRLTLKTVPQASDEDLAKLAALAKSARREGDALVVELAQESDVDKVVDLVRARGLSLRELTARRPSLEQYFMQAIQVPAAAVVS